MTEAPPKFAEGERVIRRGTRYKGTVIGVVPNPDHPLGGWWYRVDLDARLGRSVETFAERVLETLSAIDRLGEKA